MSEQEHVYALCYGDNICFKSACKSKAEPVTRTLTGWPSLRHQREHRTPPQAARTPHHRDRRRDHWNN